jgi:hypothetical protein
MRLSDAAIRGHNAVATVPVAIARRSGDSATLLAAYLPTTVGDGIVFGKMLPNDPRRGKREALTAEAAGWLPEAAPEPLAFFAAAEVCCYGSGFDTAGSVLVVTAPVDAVGAGLEVLTTAEQVLEKRAQGADGVWMTLDAIATLTARGLWVVVAAKARLAAGVQGLRGGGVIALRVGCLQLYR